MPVARVAKLSVTPFSERTGSGSLARVGSLPRLRSSGSGSSGDSEDKARVFALMGGRPRAKSEEQDWMARSITARMRSSSSFHEAEIKLPEIHVSKMKVAEDMKQVAASVPTEVRRDDPHDPFGCHFNRDAFPDIFD
jgi:hypothetical protein